MSDDNDEALFIEEDTDAHAPQQQERCWKIAIVDDDEDVHKTTCFALQFSHILQRPLKFIHTYSKEETRRVFSTESDIAVILLDVVMETEHAGLELVSYIRDELKWRDTRIILRTGQPGYAPEEDAIRDYDINDYKTKSELTRKKLLTSLTAAIRSYEQIRMIDASRRGLQQIIESSATLTFDHGIQAFAAGVITQIAALCGVPPEGLLCAQGEPEEENRIQQFNVVASAGQYSHLMNCSISEIAHSGIRDALQYVLTRHEPLFTEYSMTLYFSGRNKRPLAAYIDLPYALTEINQNLLEIFCSNIGVCLDNLNLVNRLKNHAFHDQLLDLPNRVKFIEEINTRITAQYRHQVLALIDIDDFAEMNDVLGHHYGDLLLKAVADRLRQQLGQNIFLARISGDVFGLLGEEQQLLPETLKALFATPFSFEETAHAVSSSVGMVALDGYEGDGAEALKDASIALKRSKTTQRGSCTLFTRQMGIEIRERATLMQHLHKAFDAKRLFLMYQPQLDLRSGRLTGLEALIRWRTDDGALIPPNEFIPLAEYSGLIVSLGAWVMRTACFTMRRLQQMGIAPDTMAVNVSVVQFRQDDFIDYVRQALEDSGLSPHQLELEMTESVTMEGSKVFEQRLHTLRQMGVHIAIDDFGTGFSSLSYLDKLPANKLKIDRAFVRQIDTLDGPKIAELIQQLGQKLGLQVIAEGIETRHHWDTLLRMGCEQGQGFFIAHPMPEEALTVWIQAHRLSAADEKKGAV